MKLLIATGIFEPEAGGPATYAPKIGRELANAGWDVTILTFSKEARYDFDAAYPFKLVRIVRGNPIANRLVMLKAAFTLVRSADLVYTLDWWAVGLPIAIASLILRKPYVVRVGGDYLWEQRYLEADRTPLPLADFYERGIYREARYRIFFLLNRWVFRHATHVVFNSDIQRMLYEKFYGLARTSSIYNPIPRGIVTAVRTHASNEFVYWGRFIVMKNLASLVRAFKQADLPPEFTLTLIGDGPRKQELIRVIDELGMNDRVSVEPGMKFDAVMERVKNARAFVLPSWTDISPNQVYEALAISLPSLVTKENYLSVRDQIPDMIDPRSVDDIAAKFKMLADPAAYERFAQRFNSVAFEHDWKHAGAQHKELFERLIRPLA